MTVNVWKRIWNDPVWSKVISAAILAALAAVGAYLLDWWSTIGRLLAYVFSLALDTLPVPNWLLVVLALFSLPCVVALCALLWEALSQPKPEMPAWQAYTEDNFFGLRWRWNYGDGQLSTPATYCPHCDYQVFPSSASAYLAIDRIQFHCDSCSAQLGEFEESWDALENKVRRLVQQKLRNGTWNKSNAS